MKRYSYQNCSGPDGVPSWTEMIEDKNGDYCRFDEIEELENKRAKLEQFLRDYVKESLTDLLNYIDNAGWTRHQQAEHDDCTMMIAKLEEILK